MRNKIHWIFKLQRTVWGLQALEKVHGQPLEPDLCEMRWGLVRAVSSSESCPLTALTSCSNTDDSIFCLFTQLHVRMTASERLEKLVLSRKALDSYTATVLLEAVTDEASSLEGEPQAPNPNRGQEVKLAQDLGHHPTSSAHTAVPSAGHCHLPMWQEGDRHTGRRNRPEVSQEASEHPPHTRLFTEA